MNNYTEWTADFGTTFLEMITGFIHYLPTLLGGILILLGGWFAARLLRLFAVRLARLLDQTVAHLSRRPPPERPRGTPPWGRLLGTTVFWATILFFVALSTHVLGLEAFSAWLNRVVAYLPTLFAGALIILAGILVSALTRDLVIATAPLPESQRLLLGRLVQVLILLAAAVIGADQIGVNVTFVVIIAAVVLATLLGGIALAVSLGARTVVANLISGHAVRQTYHIGQRLRIAGFEGRILDITPTAVVLETPEGRVSLPAKYFSEQPAVVLMQGPDA